MALDETFNPYAAPETRPHRLCIRYATARASASFAARPIIV